MSTFQAPIVKFKLEKIENSDHLSLAHIKGWQCVVRTEDFSNDSFGVYVPLDAVADKDHPLLGFMKGKKVKTIKLRGVISQGVLLPLSQVKDYAKEKGVPYREIIMWQEDDDLHEVLEIKKWEAPIKPVRLQEGGGYPYATVESPAFFEKYTDIENWNNWPDIIQEGELVQVTEKIHGCLKNDTRILLPDGSNKRIKDLVESNYNGYVLGFDGKNVVPSKVLNVFNNGKDKKINWKIIKIKKTKAGRGSWLNTVKCTDNHKFYDPTRKKYIQAKNLKVGDTLLTARYDLGLTYLQEQILIGKLLGDGSLCIRDSGSGVITFGHKKDHEPYLNWTLQGLGDIAGNKDKDRISGYGSKMCRGKTLDNYFIAELFRSWMKEKTKQFPEDFIEKTGPIALAFWFMDDGSLAHNTKTFQEDRAYFATCSFSKKSISNLVKVFAKFDIVATPYKTEKGWRLRLNANEADKLFMLIAPYIPKTMQYKLPTRYRGYSVCLPKEKNHYKKSLVEQEIISIEDYSPSYGFNKNRYDLETETHNFFANGVLVHNSSARFALVDNQYYIGSRNRCLRINNIIIRKSIFKSKKLTNFFKSLGLFWFISKKEIIPPEDTVWHQAYRHFNMEKTLLALREITGEQDVAIYGEITGVQDLMYGMTKGQIDFYVYDIKLGSNATYLAPEQFSSLIKKLNLKRCPLLYAGRFTSKTLELRKGDSTIPGAGHVREGIVIEPTTPRWESNLGRVILKKINEDYLLRQKGTDY